MFSFTSHLKRYLTLTPQDLRKSFNGLGAIVENGLKLKLCDGGLHLFINKNHTQLRLLYFERHQYAVFYQENVLSKAPVPMRHAREGGSEGLQVFVEKIIAP